LGKMMFKRSPSSSGMIVLKLMAYVLYSPFTTLDGVIVKVSKKFYVFMTRLMSWPPTSISKRSGSSVLIWKVWLGMKLLGFLTFRSDIIMGTGGS
jgi:hypothetical protein